MTQPQRDALYNHLAADSSRLISICRRLGSRRPPSLARTQLFLIAEHLELLVEQATRDSGHSVDLPESY